MDREAEIRQVRADIEALARLFAQALDDPLRAALERNLERAVALHGTRVSRMDDDLLRAFRHRTTEAVARSTSDVVTRVRAIDLWTSPTITFAPMEPPEGGWDSGIPVWMARVLRRVVRASRRAEGAIGPLDEPTNRVWLTILNAADALDPVLTEFGFEPSGPPDPGGGHFQLQPRTLAELDSTGRLAALWEKYRALYERFRWLATEGHRVDAGATAIKRWREAGPKDPA